MYQQLFATSPLLLLPSVAVWIFFIVYVAIVIREMLNHKDVVAAAAAIPLSEESADEQA